VETRDGVRLVMLDDLESLSEVRVVVPEGIVPLLFFLLDGTRDRDSVGAEWATLTGRALPEATLDLLLSRLEEGLLLEGERVEAARRAADEAWRSRPARRAAHAGTAYPAEGAALRDWLRRSMDDAAVAVRGPVLGVLAPHIDPRGGAVCHGAAARAIAASPAEIFVVLGTAHHPLRRPFALTRHDFETPTGTLPTDRALVERLASRGGGGLLEDDRSHEREHSVEFQAAWIHSIHGHRPEVRVVPVLVGSLHDHLRSGESPSADPRRRDFVEALRELRAEHGERMAVVASIDLAHVGPRYGHDRAPDDEALADVMEKDRALLARAHALDDEAWFRFLADEGDARNVCGAAPAWVFLRALAGTGLAAQPLAHAVWEIDPDTGSHVSFAAVAYAPAPAAVP
jgi:AmmeMemoRadiSam system protein B